MYGYDGTIHDTTHLDVELDEDGNVVSVWFRCCALPFAVTKVGYDRAADMRTMSARVNRQGKLLAVDMDHGD